MENKDMSLKEYITTLITLHDTTGDGEHKEQIEEIKRLYGHKTTTFDDVEQAVRIMVGSILQDNSIGEQVQGVFNQSILELLVSKEVITDTDYNNVAEIMESATQQLYKEIQ